jgi:putative glutamine amidotransferase
MQPVIAITVGEVINFESGKAWTPTIYGQFHTYTDAVVRAGGAPFVLPLVDDEKVLRRLYEQCDGLLLSGGHDLDLIAAENTPGARLQVKVNTSPRRDKQEIQMLKWAVAEDKPVLGICRGMQLINVALGGTLHKHIPDDLPTARDHELSVHNKDMRHLAHQLALEPGSHLARILGTTHIVANTLHHQAVDKLGEGLIVSAHAEDGIIEGIELPDKRFVIGVQSHPEALEESIEPLWQTLFKAFIEASMALTGR